MRPVFRFLQLFDSLFNNTHVKSAHLHLVHLVVVPVSLIMHQLFLQHLHCLLQEVKDTKGTLLTMQGENGAGFRDNTKKLQGAIGGTKNTDRGEHN